MQPRTIDQYANQLSGTADSRALRVGFGGDAATCALADRFGEVHCVDFSTEDLAAASRNGELCPNIFTYLARRPDLQQFSSGSFLFADIAPFPWHADRDWIAEALRNAARVLKPGGLLHMRIPPAQLNEGELIDFTRRFQLQTLVSDTGTSLDAGFASSSNGGASLVNCLWRRCEMGWREELTTLAGITAVEIRKITNAQRAIPVAPCRGPFASINIFTHGLPAEADIFDLEVRIGGSRARIASISPADAKEIRQVVAHLPELEQTGLLPVDLFWMDERMGKPGVLRVVPPPPLVPRIVSVTPQPGGTIAVVIDELREPEDFSATVESRPAWGYENRCLDAKIPRYEIRFQLPDSVEPGDRELALRIGRRELPAVIIRVPAFDTAYQSVY